ncbi:MAG: hypothetical protein ACKO96_00025 [Flammeovirgaceae bacterium]
MKNCSAQAELVDMFCWLELESASDLLIPINDSGSLYGGGDHWAMLHIKAQSGESTLFDSAIGCQGVKTQTTLVIN